MEVPERLAVIASDPEIGIDQGPGPQSKLTLPPGGVNTAALKADSVQLPSWPLPTTAVAASARGVKRNAESRAAVRAPAIGSRFRSIRFPSFLQCSKPGKMMCGEEA